LIERISPESDAAAWLARLRAHDVTDDDRASFAAWLAADARHRAEFDALTDLWHELEPVARSAALPPLSVRRASPRLPLAAAAVVLLTAVVLFVQPFTESYRTVRGGLATHVLHDGTRLHLNTETAVHIDYDDNERRIVLDHGELFVEVASDPDRPLTVVTRYGDAMATGTAFAVRDAADRVFVTVTEGRVRVRSADTSTQMLGTDDQAVLGPTAAITRRVDGDAVTSWRDGALVYDGVPLGDLIDDLNRYLPRRMRIADPELATRRVSAVLRLGDQEQMLEALSRTLPMRWTIVSDTLILLHAA
jgi:transmembrane sensor